MNSTKSVAEARAFEIKDKQEHGLPPYPKEFEGCRKGAKLKHDLLQAAGQNTWERGYVEAIFDVGEDFNLLKDPRFEKVWARVGGWPPGPWNDTA